MPRGLWLGALRSGVKMLTWCQNSFAYADSFDEETGRYRRPRAGQIVSIANNDLPGLAVGAAIARKQQEADVQPGPEGSKRRVTGSQQTLETVSVPNGPLALGAPHGPKRFRGSVPLDPVRASRDVGNIVEGVISQFTSIVGAGVRVAIESDAAISSGASDNTVRAAAENTRTLKFTSARFEKE